jgi:hypothetical protein
MLFKQPGQMQEQGQMPQQQMPMFPSQPMISFDEEQKDDLTRFQLDISKTKSDISHWLNGDTPEEDDKGKVKWVKNENPDYRVLNEFGRREIMRIVNMYLTKDVILSNLAEEKINQICQDIGEEINDLFFTKYEEIGLDNDSRMKNYSSIIVTIVHIIYITLMRAEGGKERKSVTENRIVNQTEINPMNYPRQGGFSLNPFRGFRR